MRCSIKGCPGAYEEKLITEIARKDGKILVIDHVPAEICSVCGDVLLTPGTVRCMEALLQKDPQPARTVPLYEFA